MFGEQKAEGFSLPVDLIRTVAILFVILLHASAEPNVKLDMMSSQGVQLWWAADVYGAIARTAVPLFVMLTGALLLQPSKIDEPLRVFFKKRWNRIGIPVIFWMIVFFAWNALVRGNPLTFTSFVDGVLVGPYVQFWYVYLLIGLYLITPVIRVVVAHANWSTARYFLLLWFIGTGVVSLLTLTSFSPQVVWFRSNVFLITGMLGYFVLGAYITRLKFRRSVLYAMLILSTVWTVFATYFLIGSLGEFYSTFFMDASSFSIILTSMAIFLILAAVPNQTLQDKWPRANKVLQTISANTLPIYLFHLIILETLQKGYLGIQISVTNINPVISIPLVTAITLLITLAIVVLIKKIPYVRRIIG
jgi:surface polysaccharide O-acyltransferase-like enzyme